MVVAQREEPDRIRVHPRREQQRARRRGDPCVAAGRARDLDDPLARQDLAARRDRREMLRIRIRRFGKRRHQRDQRAHDRNGEVHRDRCDRNDEQQPPHPHAARAVQVEHERVAAAPHAERERLAPAFQVRKRQHQRDQAVDRPHDADDAHHPEPEVDPAVHGQEQRVVQPVDERHQVKPRERRRAPFAAALHRAGRGIDGDLAETECVRLAGRRIGTRHHARLQRVSRFDRERQISHLHARIGGLDARREFERRQRRRAAARGVEIRVQHRVELMVPRNQCAGEPRDEQEQRDGEPEPAVQAHEKRSQERIHRVRSERKAGRHERRPRFDGMQFI
ncbi:Uncharacterised protein [Clostridium sporogenes]|nr:Uncharacterised protein [Clostridium sporogenes]